MNPYRSPDHDPVLVGLQLDWPTPQSTGDQGLRIRYVRNGRKV